MYINLIGVFVRLNMDQQEIFECDQSFFPSWQSPNYGPKLLPQPNTTGGPKVSMDFQWIYNIYRQHPQQSYPSTNLCESMSVECSISQFNFQIFQIKSDGPFLMAGSAKSWKTDA